MREGDLKTCVSYVVCIVFYYYFFFFAPKLNFTYPDLSGVEFSASFLRLLRFCACFVYVCFGACFASFLSALPLPLLSSSFFTFCRLI